MDRQLLLVDCPDEPGLIYRITRVLYEHDCNIVRNQEFVDAETARFFMRTEFTGDRAGRVSDELAGVLPAGSNVRVAPTGGRRIVLLATREHHCVGELLLRNSFGELGASIQAVVGNHPTLAPLAERFGVPFHHVSHEGVPRPEHEARMLDAVQAYDPEYIVLAKYMRVLSPAFISHYPHRIINIHHSFLPAFAGAQPYRQAFERGVKIIGATAHFVTEVLDEGPIIAQSVIPVDHSYGPAAMAQAGRDVEKLVLARALGLVLEERVFLVGNRTIVFD
ncbi:MAG TPA: formyltetrahydrofolate deformylase [Longimicrobiaceae bacterium]|nr:formyltetrahydrofolate deformylase [Longimicrobiaceae bacterium]